MATDQAPQNESNDPYVILERHDAVGYVTFNRPERLNSFSVGELTAVEEAFTDLNNDDGIKVIVMRGRGRAFSSGHNVGDLGTQYAQAVGDGKPTQRSRIRVDMESFDRRMAVQNSPKVVIAEGKGYVLGGALHYYFAADILIAAEGTVFGSPPARMIGTGGGVHMLLRLGPAVSNEMQFLGRFFRAEELYQRGVLNRVVPVQRLEETVDAAAQMVCRIPSDGLAVGKLANRVAWSVMGADASALVNSMGHVLQVQQKLDGDDWNLFRERKDNGPKGAWQNRDTPWTELMERYDSDGFRG